MPAQLRLLESDGISPLVSINFGNILAGTQSVPKLLFMNSYGDAACNSSEFAVEQTPGNDGYTFAQVAAANTVDNAATTINSVVSTSGGSIAAGADIAYKVAVADRWGNETPLNDVAHAPSFTTGTTNQVTLSWADVVGAFKYVVYSSISGGAFYKVGEASSASFTDLTGTNDGVTVNTGTGAYYFDTWSAGPITVGDLAAGAKFPVGLRQNVPAGTTAASNPRQHKIAVSFLTV